MRNVVFLDCETSGVTNGREPACRYYMNRCIDRVVKEAEGAGLDAGAAKLGCIDGILRGVFDTMLSNKLMDAWETSRLEASFYRIMQDFIPMGNAHNAHLKRFVYMKFDGWEATSGSRRGYGTHPSTRRRRGSPRSSCLLAGTSMTRSWSA